MSDARTLALRVLTRVFDEGAYADRAFSGEAERARVDARERALAMHLAFGAVQRRRTLDAALEEIAGRPVQRLERRLAHVLQLGVFQILFADGIPPHAAVSESVELARREIGPRATGLVNAVLRRIAREGPEWYAALPEDTPEEAALRHSLPDWIAELWFDAYGEERGGRCARPPTARPRCRSGRTRCATARPRWRPGCARPAPRPCATMRPECCGWPARSTSPARPPSRPARSSRSLAPPSWSPSGSARRPGMRVLDLCAAPGGKTAVLAASGAQVTAVDAHPARAKALEATLRRLGVEAEVVTADGRTYRGGPFDRILVDAPCSGLGVLAGRPGRALAPHARGHGRPGDPANGARRPRPRPPDPTGSSTSPSARSTPKENEAIAPAAGLIAHDELRTWPDEGDDGFYAARLTPP